MDTFREFRKLCSSVAQSEVLEEKQEIIRKFFSGDFKGDLHMWLRCLCHHSHEGPYDDDKLSDLFGKALRIPAQQIRDRVKGSEAIDDVLVDLFSNSQYAARKSKVTLQQVDDFLSSARNRRIDDATRVKHLRQLLTGCTPNDVKILVWMMQHELNLDVDVLAAVDSQLSRDYRKLKDLDKAVGLFLKRQKESRVSHHPEASGIRKFLPDFLTGVRIYVEEGIEQRDTLRRYVIAYNGQVVGDADDADTATLVVRREGNRGPSKGIVVHPNWLWNCLKQQERLDHVPYMCSSTD